MLESDADDCSITYWQTRLFQTTIVTRGIVIDGKLNTVVCMCMSINSNTGQGSEKLYT